MGQNAIISLQIDWPYLELALHNPETSFNLPAASIHRNNAGRVIFQIGADSIKAVVSGFPGNSLFVQIIDILLNYVYYYAYHINRVPIINFS